ncbi:hypothetical protein HDV01_004831 [Terramyces sp. JEL0728]|nr:hypothetical protein HDV01_004831 [Terramyces sp. JEL0728]
MIRVWGGGVYQSDEFYSLCDELGLLVWQEFMFACALYPTDDQFLKNVQDEVSYQIKRIASHPCICLWSGNNEALVTGWFEIAKKNPYLYAIDYHRLYHETIMPIVQKLDPHRQFVSSSPSNGTVTSSPFTERFISITGDNDLYGDAHYFNYVHDGLDASKYRKPRFMSEYGFMSLPSFNNLKTVSEEEDWTPLSPFMIQRNHHLNGQQEIIKQMEMHFKLPYASADKMSVREFDNFCYLSQIVQALIIKSHSEYYRREMSSKANCMGALYWNCNDIWQAPTWSSIEYNGTWKILHYYAQSFFSPILISSECSNGIYNFVLLNDSGESLAGKLQISLVALESGNVIHSMEYEYSGSLPSVDFNILASKLKASNFMISYRFVDSQGQTLSSNTDFFKPLKTVKLSNPELVLSGFDIIDTVYELTISAKSLALFVNIEVLKTADMLCVGRFSKNGFHMMPDSTESIKFYCNGKVDLRLSDFYIRSLYDTGTDIELAKGFAREKQPRCNII